MRRSLRGRFRYLLAAVAVVGAIVTAGLPANAVHDEGFALQGDVDHGSLTDWVDLFDVTTGTATPKASLPAGFVEATFKKDWPLPDQSGYATGTKDDLKIGDGVDANPATGTSSWQCKEPNNLGPKFDIVNAYAAAFRPTTGTSAGDLIVYFASEISSENGSRNAGFWLLKDKDAGCESPDGGNTNWAGRHNDGDVLVVSAFTNGGTKSQVTVYEWSDPSPATELGGSLELVASFGSTDAKNPNNATCLPPNQQPQDDRACAIANAAAEVNPPWDAPDSDGDNLNVNEFVEGAVNLTELGLGECFSTFVANSRSSHEPGATLHDFASDDFETCGDLTVNKYIDVNMNGALDAGTDVTTGTAVSGYAFTVKGPAPSTATVCSGTTNSNGELVCSAGALTNLFPGNYTVTETQKTGFFNTDPGPNTFNTSATVSKVAAVTAAGGTVQLGNTCYVDKTFRINNVPSGVGTIKVDYQATGGPGGTTTATVNLVTSGTVASATVNDVFNQKDTLAWQWYLASNPADKITGGSGESLAGGAFPACALTNQDDFDNTPISGTKFKDADADGVRDTTGTVEGGLAGFVFDLRAGSSTTGTILQTTTSTATGDYSFAAAVPPGTYTVTERPQTGWVQTTPTVNTGRTFTIGLNQSAFTVPEFGNTPLSRITVTFEALADLPNGDDATQATSISCDDAADEDVGSTTTTNTVTTDELKTNQSSVVCTITYQDP